MVQQGSSFISSWLQLSNGAMHLLNVSLLFLEKFLLVCASTTFRETWLTGLILNLLLPVFHLGATCRLRHILRLHMLRIGREFVSWYWYSVNMSFVVFMDQACTYPHLFYFPSNNCLPWTYHLLHLSVSRTNICLVFDGMACNNSCRSHHHCWRDTCYVHISHGMYARILGFVIALRIVRIQLVEWLLFLFKFYLKILVSSHSSKSTLNDLLFSSSKRSNANLKPGLFGRKEC